MRFRVINQSNAQPARPLNAVIVCSYVQFMHFCLTILKPNSSYSNAVIHEEAKVLKVAKDEAPYQTERFLSAGAKISKSSAKCGASSMSSDLRRSPKPSNMVEPPDRTTLYASKTRQSMSEAKIDFQHKS